MKQEGIKLTASEWSVLSCLWERSPQTVMELVGALKERVGWAKSTTITTVRRMEGKGLVHWKQEGKTKSYTPAVEKEQAVTAETHSFLERVYEGSVGLMMSAMARRRELTAEEIAQLRAILEEAEEGTKAETTDYKLDVHDFSELVVVDGITTWTVLCGILPRSQYLKRFIII